MSKLAVIFGDNYPNTENELSGCVADADYQKDLVHHFNFDDVEVLHDEDCTKSAMKSVMVDMLQSAKPGDVVYFPYSGHGTIIPPGVQSLVPYDFDWDNPETWLTYDELDQLFLKYERDGVQVILLADSCHSQADPRKHFRDLQKGSKAKNRFLTPPAHILKRIVSDPFHRNVLSKDQDDLLLAGCMKNQTSADAEINGSYHGAFTYSLSVALQPFMEGKVRTPPSYQQLILQSRSWLAKNGYDQVPSANGDAKLLQLPFLSGLSSKKGK